MPAAPSKLEKDFSLYWRASGGLPLKTEVRFHPVRKWRFDAAHMGAKVAIEMEGGVFTGGRHTRGAGYSADCEKYIEAALQGWVVFRLTRDQLKIPIIERIAAYVAGRNAQLGAIHTKPDPYALAR